MHSVIDFDARVDLWLIQQIDDCMTIGAKPRQTIRDTIRTLSRCYALDAAPLTLFPLGDNSLNGSGLGELFPPISHDFSPETIV
jgi:hypothetical protein